MHGIELNTLVCNSNNIKLKRLRGSVVTLSLFLVLPVTIGI